MKVLIGCEYSGVVRDAFIKAGHDAISCDMLPTESEGPHYQGDIFDMLSERWDLIIMHPPCTALSLSGNRHYGQGMPKHHLRIEAIAWTQALWEKCLSVCDRVVFENPASVLSTMATLPKPQFIQPWMFGHMEQKKTGLHIHGLPSLEAENNVYDEMMKLPKKERERIHYMSPGENRGKERSKTYQGIADAFARQWGK